MHVVIRASKKLLACTPYYEIIATGIEDITGLDNKGCTQYPPDHLIYLIKDQPDSGTLFR